ncbi:MAG: hypothetical protein JOY92_04510 [Verrucomicrobia bacterium]|nr:hypothetical protein [Verrucomicrobiota bacterium]
MSKRHVRWRIPEQYHWVRRRLILLWLGWIVTLALLLSAIAATLFWRLVHF